MALEDVDENTHTWYKNAYGNLPEAKKVDSSSNDFGSGKSNTNYWIKDEGNLNQSYPLDSNDMWQIIKDESNTKYKLDRWFVPSRAEWSAFGDMLWTQFSVNTKSYVKFGLKDWYWSSSQGNAYNAWYAGFRNGYMTYDNVFSRSYVRLSATF